MNSIDPVTEKIKDEQSPLLMWDSGTAYDLFASLHVLHHPDRFDLRKSWAAGVRSRLPAAQRKVLEDAQNLIGMPIYWIYQLPEPKDASTALWVLSKLPATERLPALSLGPDLPPDIRDVYLRVTKAGTWSDTDLGTLRSFYIQRGWSNRLRFLAISLNLWAQSGMFGDAYLDALQAYQVAFFAEDEMRIRPALEDAVRRAQDQAEHLTFSGLIDALSQGVQIDALTSAAEVVLAPAYWITPLVFYGQVAANRMLLLFGARSAQEALVPGEWVPDAMLRGLKTLADPSRLRLLRYLNDKPLTPAELSRRLRLRSPTVIHHLNALRLAGLVHLQLDASGEKRYTLRPEAIGETYAILRSFLSIDEESRG